MENIGGSFDPHYRYKMPILTIENRKGKTYITNLDSIAKSLDRHPFELLKMFSYEHGANTNTKQKYITGKYTFNELHDNLVEYIDKFIICQTCGNPETVYKLSKDQLCLHCKACSGISKVKESSKLKKYICKQM